MLARSLVALAAVPYLALLVHSLRTPLRALVAAAHQPFTLANR